ncbi:MAG TPA: phosphoserine phosphatase SerB [Xanthobacteraceae bacterium]|nr:phosphoserine phosphatase SerB [Xanthobacteraceae bacterium]
MAPSPTSHVATLVSDPARPVLTDAILAAARTLLPGAGAPVWLAQGIAADIPFAATNAALRALTDQVRPRLGSPVDVVIQPAHDRRKKLYLTDMDSTVIEQECIDELADFAGLKEHVAKITERAMNGEIAFEPALRERVALLKGLPLSVIDEVIEKRITLMPGGKTLVATLRRHGVHTCLVSGGFTLFTGRIARMLGFDEHRGNVLLAENGKLAGRVEEPILGKEAKLATLKELTVRLSLKPEDSLVSGDGANDMPMIEAAGLGIAFRAKPVVAASAPARIDHGDLTALLYVQGYRRDEFAA